ncbi:MAG: hypothetical protein AAFN48_09865, partial [Pseudomonadota bacterium]
GDGRFDERGSTKIRMNLRRGLKSLRSKGMYEGDQRTVLSRGKIAIILGTIQIMICTFLQPFKNR